MPTAIATDNPTLDRPAAGVPLYIRPVGADDIAREVRFIASMSVQTRYERLFSHRALGPGELRRLVSFDVRREIALMTAVRDGNEEQIVGVARLKKSADGIARASASGCSGACSPWPSSRASARSPA